MILLLLCATEAGAQSTSDCLDCHDDQTLVTQHGDTEVSLHVDPKTFAASQHSTFACIACHTDLKGKEFPHEELPGKASCLGCHAPEQAAHAASLHGAALARGDALAPRCQDCHRGHDILAVKDPASAVAPLRIPQVCGRCHREGAPVQRQREIHQDKILENYSESIHGEGLLKKGLAVTATCSSCHTAHSIRKHSDPLSSIARQNIAATCIRCHAQVEVVHRKIINGKLWEQEAHVLPACVDCHQPHKARKVFYEQGMADQDCLLCHGREDLKNQAGRSLYVKADELAHSRHAQTACSQCHIGVTPSLERACATLTQKVACATCHEQVGQEYQDSTHGRLFAKHDPNAPTCLECHGTHAILGKQDSASATHPVNVPDLCARCHREGEKAALRYNGAQHDITRRYAESTHGKGLLKSGLLVTAMCTSCHTPHHELPRDNPASSVYRENVPDTCGRCHHGIQERFERSIHSRHVSTSDQDLPVCSDCHTAHTIRRTDETGFRLEMMDTCGKCHADLAQAYFESYHGKVTQLGYTKTAKCYDCHGAHEILPRANPHSSLHASTVVGTCNQCHSGATLGFTSYLTHGTHNDPQKYPWLFVTYWAMTGLLVGTFTFFGLHTLLWLPRALYWRHKFPHLKPAPGEKEFVRFSPLNRTLHILMVISFMTLALTGMALKFSYTGWAATMSRLLGGFQAMGFLHRIAAVLMVGLFVTHLISLVHLKRTKYGTWRALLLGPNTMIPLWKDAVDFWATVKWFVGAGPRPQYGRWTYWEKFDYFAVFWGIAIIGSSGAMLWFAEEVTRVLPGWLLNVATIIHSDEALLAAGFIFTIHFFNAHLRPEKFPMDLVIFTGRMPVEELKRDKPLEYATLAASGELEGRLAEPLDPATVRGLRVFAWCALFVGSGIVGWIVYALAH